LSDATAVHYEAPVLGIVDFLDLEPLGDDRFRGPIPHYEHRPTLFGGQVVSQALRAASLTVDDTLRASSMHAHYLRPGSREEPVQLVVRRVREGRSFVTRTVDAVQGGKVVAMLDATFHLPEPGPSRSIPMPDAPPPDAVAPVGSQGTPDVPMDVRTIDPDDVPKVARLALWARSLETWPDDASLRACLLAYVADMRTGFASVAGLSAPSLEMMASLDHTVWFHREFDPGAWLLIDMQPLVNEDARGLVLGTIHDVDGTHVATFAQEMLHRLKRPSSD
jgi:acyl-CoA thioesterase-2